MQKLFPKFVWNLPASEKIVYLTFDDGPHPEITPMVLDILDEHNAKACFFCVGDNVRKYPETFQLVQQRNHSVGNHTYNHLSGWATNNSSYFENVELCNDFVKTDLLRPPYGRIKLSQAAYLRNNYKIVMWDILSCDYERNLNRRLALKNMLKHTKPGSVVVFHDSNKARENMFYLLKHYLIEMNKLGYSFKKLEL